LDRIDERNLDHLRSTLKMVISTSETMSERQRDQLSARIGRPVVDEYGCSEVDIISFLCPEGSRHTIAENVLVETVRLGDEPAGYGRVVVTDLNNTLMPVVRYVVGDLVPLERPQCGCGRGWPCLGPVLGRVQDQFIEIGDERRKVHSQFVVYLLERMLNEGWGVGRFQIVQEAADLLLLRVVPGEGKPLDDAALARRLADEGRRILGPQMRWRVELVSEAQLETTASRKFRHFVSQLTR
jgi:phenylacetate-CoA ligase